MLTAPDIFDLPPLAVPCSAEVDAYGDQLPAEVADWLGGLVYEPKREYAEGWAMHVLLGSPPPVDPGDEWAAKARKRFATIMRRATARPPKAREVTARAEYLCTQCGEVIGKGDHYVTRVTPAWLNNGVTETLRACYHCSKLVTT